MTRTRTTLSSKILEQLPPGTAASRAALADTLGLEPATVATVLGRLKRDGTLTKDADDLWRLTATATPTLPRSVNQHRQDNGLAPLTGPDLAPLTGEADKKRAEDDSRPFSNQTVYEPTGPQSDVFALELALDDLSEKLSAPAPRNVADMDIKAQTLARLAPLMDDSIAQVLNAIWTDLHYLASLSRGTTGLANAPAEALGIDAATAEPSP